MTNPEEHAFPSTTHGLASVNTTGGLTKLEYFAAAALQGLLANEGAHPFGLDSDAINMARKARRFADALLAILDDQ